MAKAIKTFAELEEIGYKNLEGEERALYRALKKEQGNSKLEVDHVVTAQDMIDNPDFADSGIKEGDTIKVPMADEPKEKVSEEKAEVVKGTGKYVMTRNVLCNDQNFKKGEEVAANNKSLKLFLEKGYAREMVIS